MPPNANPIPDKLINAAVYYETDELLGMATVKLPELSYMSENISGLGIAGELETPVMGHFQSITLALTWNTMTKDAVKLMQTMSHQINVRASIQRYDGASGKLESQAVKLVANVMPKKTGMGKTEPGKKMDSETEMEASYLKLWIGGEEMLEIDKFNFICRIMGKDMLSTVRADLGK